VLKARYTERVPCPFLKGIVILVIMNINIWSRIALSGCDRVPHRFVIIYSPSGRNPRGKHRNLEHYALCLLLSFKKAGGYAADSMDVL
jgi:hypothetical protein